jgi:hypothetical protein
VEITVPKTRDPHTLRGKPPLRKRWRDPRTPAERGVVRDAVFALLRERGVADDPDVVKMARCALTPQRDGQKLYAPAIVTLGDMPKFEQRLDAHLAACAYVASRHAGRVHELASHPGASDHTVEDIDRPLSAHDLERFALTVQEIMLERY